MGTGRAVDAPPPKLSMEREPNAEPLMSRLEALRIRMAARSYKRLAWNAAISELFGVAQLLAYIIRRGQTKRRLEHLLTAARRLHTKPLRAITRAFLAPWLTPERSNVFRREEVGWSYYRSDFGGLEFEGLASSLLLKAPGANGERGVLYVSFEYNWMRLVANYDARRFFQEYILVGASSWSPPDYASFANLSGLSSDPMFIGISNVVDVQTYRMFEPHIRALPLLASDWIKPENFSPRPYRDREIDIIMVANWLQFKRHWLLFQALRDMDPKLRVLLIGRNGDGRTEREIRAEARAFGVKQDLELVTDVPIADVIAHQCNAKVSALFSGREGSCVAVTECFFADTPVVMMHDAHVGSKAYINARTGMLASPHTAASALTRMLERPEELAPRAWAIENISCYRSSEKLNAILRDYCRQLGQSPQSE